MTLSPGPEPVRAGILPALAAAILPAACTNLDTPPGRLAPGAEEEQRIVRALYARVEAEISRRIEKTVNREVDEVLRNLTREELYERVQEAVVRAIPRHVAVEQERLVRDITDELIVRITADNRLSTSLASWQRDVAILRTTMLDPVVQISVGDHVAAGTLLHREQRPEGDFHYYVLTCWHTFRVASAVDRAMGGDGSTLPPISIKLYRDGEVDTEQARLIHRDERRDLALLSLASPHELRTARFDLTRTDSNLQVLSPVLVVGCPLGSDPIPTAGMVSDLHHEVERVPYLMTTAPAHIGNSGGPMYSLETGELEGVFVKVYMAGAGGSTVVSHMGLGVPRAAVHEFLTGSGLPTFSMPSPESDPGTGR